jgi:hypothetical protein
MPLGLFAPLFLGLVCPNNNTAIDANQIDDDILSYTVSDEEIEAAVGTERGEYASYIPPQSAPCLLRCPWE